MCQAPQPAPTKTVAKLLGSVPSGVTLRFDIPGNVSRTDAANRTKIDDNYKFAASAACLDTSIAPFLIDPKTKIEVVIIRSPYENFRSEGKPLTLTGGMRINIDEDTALERKDLLKDLLFYVNRYKDMSTGTAREKARGLRDYFVLSDSGVETIGKALLKSTNFQERANGALLLATQEQLDQLKPRKQ